MSREFLEGEWVLYRLGRRKDPEWPGVYITLEVPALVVRVGRKRVSVRPRFGDKNAPLANARSVTAYRLRDW